MLSVKQGGIKYHFWVFRMTRPGIETWSPGPLANILGILDTNTVKQAEMKEKINKRVPQTNEKVSRNEALQQKS